MRSSVTLHGAVGEVTGSAYHVQTSRASVMVDFGLFQGRDMASEANHVLLQDHRAGHLAAWSGLARKTRWNTAVFGDALLLLGQKQDIARLRGDDNLIILEERRELPLQTDRALNSISCVESVSWEAHPSG